MDFEKRGKRVLVLGGTGAMGVYLVEELLGMGCAVDVVSLDDKASGHPALRYIRANAKDDAYLEDLVKGGYDGIVDFLIYSTEEFRKRHGLLLGHTGHYIFLSSYRVYAGSEGPLTESSPQLLDVSTDQEFLASDDYSLAKARQEDILEDSKRGNWTIVRPAITFSQRKYQLVTLEANVVVQRARRKQPVVLPREALSRQTTMTWAGDVAAMLARLLFLERAYREHYTTATAEHTTWEAIAGYYHELLGLEAVQADRASYLRILSPNASARWAQWQLDYDRLFDRIVDNSKVLVATGLTQSSLMPLRQGLQRELSALPQDARWDDPGDINGRMDEFLRSR